jgi:RNA-directed DNA polymerase
MTAFAFDVAMAALGVNGPEDDTPRWDDVAWRRHEENVRRLRGRIFKATTDGDWPKVRNLQKLMLRSWSNTLTSVRQVAQRNAGRTTAGIDGKVALTGPARMNLAVQTHRTVHSFTPLAVKRVYIVRRVALRRIPCSAGRNSEGGFWVCWLTRS